MRGAQPFQPLDMDIYDRAFGLFVDRATHGKRIKRWEVRFRALGWRRWTHSVAIECPVCGPWSCLLD